MKEKLKDLVTGVKDLWTGDFFDDSEKQERAKDSMVRRFLGQHPEMKSAYKAMKSDEKTWFRGRARVEFDHAARNRDGSSAQKLVKSLGGLLARAADPIRAYEESESENVSGLRSGARSAIDFTLRYSGWRSIGRAAKSLDSAGVPQETKEWWKGGEGQPESHTRSALKGVFGGTKALGKSVVDALKSK